MAYGQAYPPYPPNAHGYPPQPARGPPKQDYGYDNGYQHGYGYDNSNSYTADSYDQYNGNPYADETYHQHDDRGGRGGAWGNTYDFDSNDQYARGDYDYDNYGSQHRDARGYNGREPERDGYPPMNGHGRGPPPPGPARGDHGGRGPPRGPPGGGPRGPDPRSRDRGGHGPPPGHFDPEYPPPGGRRPDPRGPPPPSAYRGGPDRPGHGRPDRGGRQRARTMEKSRDPYGGGEWGQGGGRYGDDQGYEDPRSRGPMPTFHSIKGRPPPPHERPGTSNGVVRRQDDLQPSAHYYDEEPQTAPVTPQEHDFSYDSRGESRGPPNFSSPTAAPGYFGGGQQFNLPTRSQTVPPEQHDGPGPVELDEEMPSFKKPLKRAQTTPQPNGYGNSNVFEMPGDYPPRGAPHAAGRDRRPPPGPGGEYGQGYPLPNERGPPSRQPRGPPPARGGRQPGAFDPSRPGASSRPPPPQERVEHNYNGREIPLPPHMQRTSPANNASNPRQPPPNERGAPPGPDRPPYPQRNSDPESSAHPTPVRPGLMQNGGGGQSQQAAYPAKPAPVRQYNNVNDGRPQTAPENSKPGAVTHDDLRKLREMVRANPSDQKLELDLAKKLAEASTVLASDGGRADPRAAKENKERYVSEAVRIVKKLVANNYADAMFYLADCMGEEKLGQRNDPKEAFVLYQNAAKLGHAAAAYRTAVCCEIGAEEGGGTHKDTQKAFQWYKRASSLGDISATYKLGIILMKGLLSQPVSLGEAVGYLKRAAERADEDNPHALHELGLLYESDANPNVIPKDEAQAFAQFSRAAKLGYKFSQFKLGQAYEYGLLGCKIDARNSIVYYTRAAAQAEHQSELALSGWYLTGSEGILDQSDLEAYLWAKKAAGAEPPLPKAMFAMGYFLEVGIGTNRSLEDAKRWYSKAASFNFPKARERLEELRKGGASSAKSREKISRSNPKKTADECVLM